MRTTLELQDQLIAAAKRRAAENGTTLTAFVESALAAALVRPHASGAGYRLEWKTHRGRLLPGVDINDRDRLYEVLEDRR
jgi:hypothetical protein